MLARVSFCIAVTAILAACGDDRLANQASAHVQLKDNGKDIADIVEGLSSRLNLAIDKGAFDYGGAAGKQAVFQLTNSTTVIFVQNESATFCSEEHTSESPAFSSRILVVNLSASTEDQLAVSLEALRQVSNATGASVLRDREAVCTQSSSSS